MHICLKRLDAVYETRNHFIQLKARLLLGINVLLFALVFVNLIRFLWSQPPAVPLRICINLIITAAIIASIRFTLKGKLELAGSSLALGLALPIHLIIAILPGDFYQQPLGTAFQLFVFDIFLLLVSLIFASKHTAMSCFMIILLGNFLHYFKTLANEQVAGTLRYTADTLARDGLLAFTLIFAIGVFLILILEVVMKRSEQMLQSVKSMNTRLEQRVSERTQDLEEVTRKANAATRAKSDFLANMSHEIRTPLFGIIAQTELLKERKNRFSDEDVKDLEIISESGDLLLRIINDILDFSKIEAQQIKLESSPFTLSKLMGECISAVSASAKKKALTITFLKCKELNISLLGDSHRLKQVILNLLSNAVKFTPKSGEITLTVKLLEVEGDTAHVQFKVADTGIGMDAPTRENIFNRFTQADHSTTRQYGGTGLGLAISSQLVDMMGGQMTVDSQLGKGSSFEFSLVFSVVPTEEPNAQPSSPPISQRTQRKQLGMHILVAEDNKSNQLLICRQLETLGCTYKLAQNGAEALDILKSDDSLELVLMDNTMPVMDGLHATKIIREWGEQDAANLVNPLQARAAKLPIVVFTAYAIDDTQFEHDYPHMTDYLTKPLRIQQLQDVLEKYRSSSQQLKKAALTDDL